MIAQRLIGAALAAIVSTSAFSQEVTLTLHHFLSPQSKTHSTFLAPWAEKVEADSGGRIEIEIFPSMAMGGKPPELYRQVRDGFADIIWTLPGYTPGVFPRSEVFELPTVHIGSARATNLAIQDLWDRVKDDFADIHPILLHVHAGNALHVRGEVSELADVKGMKLRTPSRTGGWMIEAWGAEPVGMPVPALPQALSKGTVDGALVPFEVMPPLKLHELTDTSVEGKDGSRFGTAIFLLAMNKERYDSLPDDLKEVIDANSGAAIAEAVGANWDGNEPGGKDMQIESGGTIVGLDEPAKRAFDDLGAVAVERWIGEAEAAGIEGRALVEAARAAIAEHSE